MVISFQLSYTFMLPFEDIPDDLVPLTAHMKEMLNHATQEQPLLICLDSVDQLVNIPFFLLLFGGFRIHFSATFLGFQNTELHATCMQT